MFKNDWGQVSYNYEEAYGVNFVDRNDLAQKNMYSANISFPFVQTIIDALFNKKEKYRPTPCSLRFDPQPSAFLFASK